MRKKYKLVSIIELFYKILFGINNKDLREFSEKLIDAGYLVVFIGNDIYRMPFLVPMLDIFEQSILGENSYDIEKFKQVLQELSKKDKRYNDITFLRKLLGFYRYMPPTTVQESIAFSSIGPFNPEK